MSTFLPYERMPTESAISRFIEHWKTTAPDLPALNVRSVWMRSGNAWVHAFAHGWAAEIPEPSESLVASAVRAEAWSISGFEAIAAALRSVMDVGLSSPASDLPTTKVTHESSMARSDDAPDQLPRLLLQLDAAVGSTLPSDLMKPVVCDNGRVFSTAQGLIHSWGRWPEWKSSGGNGTRGLIVELPERRGRIAQVTASDVVAGLLTARVEPRTSAIDRVVAEVKLTSGIVMHQDLTRADTGIWQVQLPDSVREVTLIALIGADVVHIHGPVRPDAAWTGRANWVSLTELRSWIAAGESDLVEFKSWKVLTKDRDVVARAVVAFANGKGGTVLVGIDNQGQVDGMEARDSVPDAVLRAVAELSEVLRSVVDPPVPVVLQPALLDGRTLVVVRVPAGTERPHVLTTKGTAFVRAAATSRPATRAELLAMLVTEPR